MGIILNSICLKYNFTILFLLHFVKYKSLNDCGLSYTIECLFSLKYRFSYFNITVISIINKFFNAKALVSPTVNSKAIYTFKY